MGQEQVDGAHDLGLDRVDADEVLQPHLGLTGPDEGVRRPAGRQQGGQHDGAQHADDEEDGEHGAQPVREVNRGEDAMAADPADHDPAEDEGGDRHQAAKASEAASFTGLGHIGAWSFSAGACGGRDLFGRPTHDRLRSLPRGRIAIERLTQVYGPAK